MDGSGSTDAHGSVASYRWDYGGTSGGGAEDSHSCTTPGTYSCVIHDDCGTDTVSHDVVVGANQAPHAALTSDVEDRAVTTDGSGSTDADGSIESYALNFGGGTTGTSRTASHVYTTTGASRLS
jgi:large repetitive protein